MLRMKVSVIIPTLNEERAIDKVLEEIPPDCIDEIIVVDSSTDATPKIAESLGAKVVFESRKGYGRALQSGVEKARGDVVVYMDGDFTYDPRDIPLIVEPISSGRCDVVLGNRLSSRMHSGAMDFPNRVGNVLITLLFNILFLSKVNDTQCGLRAVNRRLLEDFYCSDYGMPYVTEQLIKLIREGAKIENIPVAYRRRIGTTKLSAWKDGLKILKIILSHRFSK